MLELKRLSKTYRSVSALKDISLTFEPGIYGLIGPNGAGKSTMINLISTLIKPSFGTVLYNGKNVSKLGAEYRHLIGVMPQKTIGYDEFTGYAFLFYMAALKGLNRQQSRQQIHALIAQVSLDGSIHRKIKTYSGGMRQRLMFAQALLGDPQIVIFDEPTAGLDPYERTRMRHYISEISMNRIVLIATHVIQDIESIADKIVLISAGQIVRVESPEILVDSIRGLVYQETIPFEKYRMYQNHYKISQVTRTSHGMNLRYLCEQPLDKELVTPNLEEVYLHYLV